MTSKLNNHGVYEHIHDSTNHIAKFEKHNKKDEANGQHNNIYVTGTVLSVASKKAKLVELVNSQRSVDLKSEASLFAVFRGKIGQRKANTMS